MWEENLRRLEFDKIKEILITRAYFEGGARLCHDLRPLDDLALIRVKLKETGEGVNLIALKDTSFISRAVDLGPLLVKARAFALLLPEELAQIAVTLRVMHRCLNLAKEGDFPALNALLSHMRELGDLERELGSVVDEYGQLKDDASPELMKIRRRMAQSRQQIREYLRDFIRNAENQRYLQEGLITERNGRYVVPVRQEYRHQVPGIVHDESASGATVFIEPEQVVKANNELRKLEAEEKREIERILRTVSQKVALHHEELENNLKIVSELDFILARARLALDMDAYCPEINEEGIVELIRARHPLIPKEKAVPIDVELGKDFDVLVITGPNTGGKTVTLKTVGLLTVMAMSGLFIPAKEYSRVSIFNQVFVDVGDEQSIEQSLSTFSAHMTNVIKILKGVDERSLVLLDELGSGTDPQEGSALARAILEYLVERKAKAVVTTHHSDLKALAFLHSRVKNACVEFDPVSLQPTYVLTIGMPGQSNALAIARRLGMEPSIIERAAHYVPQAEVEIGNMIRELKAAKQEAEAERNAWQRMKEEVKAREEELRKLKASMEEEYNRRLEEASREANRYIREARAEAEMVVNELKVLLKNKENIKWHEIDKVRSKLNVTPLPNNEEKGFIERPGGKLLPGDYVEIKSLKQKGYVLEGPNANGEYLIQVGVMKINVAGKELLRCSSPEEVRARHYNRQLLEKARQISPEIDLRGKLAEEALHVLDQYLEDAYLAGLQKVRVIHGKGTGALRSAVRDFLAGHRYVKEYAEAAYNEGGSGVTVVSLKK